MGPDAEKTNNRDSIQAAPPSLPEGDSSPAAQSLLFLTSPRLPFWPEISLHLAFFSLPVFQLLTTLTMDSVIISQLCPGPNLLSRLLATLSNVGAWGFRPPALNSSEGFSFPWVISSR